MSSVPDPEHPTPASGTSAGGQAEVTALIDVSKQKARQQHLQNQNNLLVRQLEESHKREDHIKRVQVQDDQTKISAAEEQSTRHGRRQNRKVTKDREIEKEWEQIDIRNSKLDKAEERNCKERQILYEEKRNIIHEKRRLLFLWYFQSIAKTPKEDILWARHAEAAVIASDDESSENEEFDKFDATTKAYRLNKSLDEELQDIDESDREADEIESKNVVSAPLPPAYAVVVESNSRISMQPTYTEKQKNHQDATPTESEATLADKSRNSCQHCNADRKARLSSEASWTRFLLYLVCIVTLVGGTAMLVAGSLVLQEGKRERNQWLEVNGLTRAYMLMVAPVGDVEQAP
ncbi:hypothetical protein NLG97_g778 [Lecanicillium saksenae]|uniref:Uncharacterized protein n=1 Tax=Lecanicillium saksenae TaxID=468837 RepID=A0ACC1R729_9HYPO|nr:hypothetical protein NLG97_g778 [Lecanicillium saksenae]